MLLLICPTLFGVLLLALFVLTRARISKCSFKFVTKKQCSTCRRRRRVIYSSSSESQEPEQGPSTSSRPNRSPQSSILQSRATTWTPPPPYSPPGMPPTANYPQSSGSDQTPPPPPYIRLHRSSSLSSGRSGQTVRSEGAPNLTSGDQLYYSSHSE